jgi:photosystem II stability/assembly factor-like uncharacterized protein
VITQRGHELARASYLALGSPLGIASVAVLVLNDHVLKQVAPSAITDKLGDFTGLFFAPYVLLLAVGALPLRLSPCAELHLARSAYAVVGLLFVALKASTVSAAILASLLAAVLGQPAVIVVDPTDLVALAVLPVSYLVWIRRRPGVASVVVFRLRHASIAICAVFAMVATSQPQPWITSAASDVADPERMYAVLSNTVADGLYETNNGGGTWTRLSTVTGDLVADPARTGRVYVLTDDSWDPRVLRLDRASREPVDIGPPSPGPRPQTVHEDGPNSVLAVPWSTDLVLLAKNGDLWRTTDSGVIWQSYGFLGSVQALAYASEARLIYLATEDTLLRSSDGGDRWTDVATLPGKPAAIAASATGSVLLAAIGKELLRSGDSGKTWQPVLTYTGAGDSSWVRWQLAFDPRDPTIVYALYGSGCCAAMFSMNGGGYWHEWGGPIADVFIGATREHPLIAISPYLKSVLRHEGSAPGTWIDVGSDLPVRR